MKVVCENKDCEVRYDNELYSECPICKLKKQKEILIDTKNEPLEEDVKIMRRIKNDKY